MAVETRNQRIKNPKRRPKTYKGKWPVWTRPRRDYTSDEIGYIRSGVRKYGTSLAAMEQLVLNLNHNGNVLLERSPRQLYSHLRNPSNKLIYGPFLKKKS
jgi:hypothetical protein